MRRNAIVRLTIALALSIGLLAGLSLPAGAGGKAGLDDLQVTVASGGTVQLVAHGTAVGGKAGTQTTTVQTQVSWYNASYVYLGYNWHTTYIAAKTTGTLADDTYSTVPTGAAYAYVYVNFGRVGSRGEVTWTQTGQAPWVSLATTGTQTITQFSRY